MDRFGREFNELIEKSYRSVQRIEQEMLRNLSGDKLSISELHLIEAVGTGGPAGLTITEIASRQFISLPSVTVAVNRLEKKGFVVKERSGEDARRVYVRLTEHGRRTDISHRYFHRQMMRAIAGSVPDAERETLIRAIESMNAFFEEKIRELAGEDGGKET